MRLIGAVCWPPAAARHSKIKQINKWIYLIFNWLVCWYNIIWFHQIKRLIELICLIGMDEWSNQWIQWNSWIHLIEEKGYACRRPFHPQSNLISFFIYSFTFSSLIKLIDWLSLMVSWLKWLPLSSPGASKGRSKQAVMKEEWKFFRNEVDAR